MKRIALVLLGLLMLSGCATQVMNLDYSVAQKPILKIDPVYIQIKDVRTEKSIISPAVKSKEIFAGGEIGLVNLTTKAPLGKTTTLKDAKITDVFREAFRSKLETMGVGILPEPDPDRAAVTIEIERLWLDLDGQSFKAEVSYLARFYNGGKEFHKERISGRAEKFKILARQTAEDCIGEAFSMAINSLDFEVLAK